MDTDLRDDQNLELATSVADAERLVADFYARFPYPWRPRSFQIVDPEHHTRFLNQALGFWHEQLVPLTNARIWVAGCGTSQAVHTALRFPRAQVLGTDVSPVSLDITGQVAAELGVTNLELRQESINSARYTDEFDYVLCTGVIHHNADPGLSLSRLAAALAPTGVLELMVYNRTHRLVTSAFQKAVRVLRGASMDFGEDLRTAKALLDSCGDDSLMAELRDEVAEMPENALADVLINPVEHSYTVRSLANLARGCGLRLSQPCGNDIDQSFGSDGWELGLADPWLRSRYARLADEDRWYLTNLLCFDRSPMLWFYLQRTRSPRQIGDQAAICRSFLDTRFQRYRGSYRTLLLGADDRYAESGSPDGYPRRAPDPTVREVYEAADGSATIGEILGRLGHDTTDPLTVNEVRTRLTTPAAPYLVSVPR